MLTLIIGVIFFAFFILYNTSEKAVLHNSFFLERWVQDHRLQGKYLECDLLLLALILSIPFFGVGAGIFLYFVILMTVASAIILLAPLRYLTYRSFLGIFFISIVVELIFS